MRGMTWKQLRARARARARAIAMLRARVDMWTSQQGGRERAFVTSTSEADRDREQQVEPRSRTLTTRAEHAERRARNRVSCTRTWRSPRPGPLYALTTTTPSDNCPPLGPSGEASTNFLKPMLQRQLGGNEGRKEEGKKEGGRYEEGLS